METKAIKTKAIKISKVLVKGRKMNEMKIKASANVCCTWQHVN